MGVRHDDEIEIGSVRKERLGMGFLSLSRLVEHVRGAGSASEES
jgi:hypothetical protein